MDGLKKYRAWSMAERRSSMFAMPPWRKHIALLSAKTTKGFCKDEGRRGMRPAEQIAAGNRVPY